MNSNETLAEIRACISIMREHPTIAGAQHLPARLAELVGRLDNHITGGGKLPEIWTGVAVHVDPDEIPIAIVDKLPDTLGGARVHWEPLPPVLDRDQRPPTCLADALEQAVARVAEGGGEVDARPDPVSQLISIADTLHGIASDLFATDAGAPREWTGPRRGDETEAWIRDARNRYYTTGPNHEPAWIALDDLLDDYRLHADVGAALSQPVSEQGDDDRWKLSSP